MYDGFFEHSPLAAQAEQAEFESVSHFNAIR